MNQHPAQGRSGLRRARASEGSLTCLVTIRCHQRQALLPPQARSLVVRSVLWLQRNRDVQVHAFTIMSSHVHLVVTLPAAELSKMMHSLKSFTANEVNKALERAGALWDEGYHERALTTDEAVEAAVRYVEDNPVTANVVTAPQQYEWSSARPEYRRIVDPWL